MATTSPLRVLGIDTSLRSTGVGVVEAVGNRLRAVEFGRIRNARTLAVSQCLRHIHEGLTELIERTNPVCVAIEGAFFCKNARTAMVLGQARGVAINAAVCRGLEVYEYAPRRVKQAVVGYGQADKSQVQSMVKSLLSLDAAPKEDEADALALAICHLHSRGGHAALVGEPI